MQPELSRIQQVTPVQKAQLECKPGCQIRKSNQRQLENAAQSEDDAQSLAEKHDDKRLPSGKKKVDANSKQQQIKSNNERKKILKEEQQLLPAAEWLKVWLNRATALLPHTSLAIWEDVS